MCVVVFSLRGGVRLSRTHPRTPTTLYGARWLVEHGQSRQGGILSPSDSTHSEAVQKQTPSASPVGWLALVGGAMSDQARQAAKHSYLYSRFANRLAGRIRAIYKPYISFRAGPLSDPIPAHCLNRSTTPQLNLA